MSRIRPHRPLRSPLLALVLFAGLGAQLPARADIYLCVDASGRKELTDNPKPGCKQLDVPNNIPAPSGRKSNGPAKPVTTPTDFPKVGDSEQRARDADRRQILNDELRAEEKKLAELKREYNKGEPERQGNEKNYAKYQERVQSMAENIARAEKNIEALRREISNIK
ncbi:DUF4124 domain-containing protein [Massilia scottii]|uniref:DUF4124 domain-containing protein n=1 Tax=Massilia scottii TaxID=3057166 RepID=UPI002796A0A8|nr:DUF4124 domain-containing protein [Massilia sp. CCM 9029]MDQ1834953.1 DUF4124 domain-containing protein [Massilia sp. CCM 9029]